MIGEKHRVLLLNEIVKARKRIKVVMKVSTSITPRFGREQKVSFLGGCGTIKNYQSESGMWLYLIEMQMGPEPDIGRIGNETRIILPETDINFGN
jgi:hypothetical protein